MHATQNQGRFCPDPRYSPNQPTGWVVTDAARQVLEQAPAPAAPVTVADVLRLAAVYLDRHGWIQGCYYDMNATVFTPAADMAGAIGMVCYGGPVEAPAQHFDDPGFLDFEEAMLHLDRWLLVNDGTQAYEFNDTHGRQAADVLRVLREAAATPADELVDALRAINAGHGELADRVKLLIPAGIWAKPESRLLQHVDYPHHPGALYDCPACEAACYCTDGVVCVRCSGGNTDGCTFCAVSGGGVR